MIQLSTKTFFNRFLPMFLSVVLVVVATFTYLTFVKDIPIAEAAPAFVQGQSQQCASCTTNNSVVFASNTVGNTILAYVVACFASSVSSFTDTKGDIFVLDYTSSINGGGCNVWVYRASSIVGGAGNTLTVTLGGSAALFTVLAVEFSGIGPYDNTGVGAEGNSASPTVSISPTATNELIFGYCSSAADVTATGSYSVASVPSPTTGDVAIYKIAGSSGAQNVTCTASSQNWSAVGVSYKPVKPNDSFINIRGGGGGGPAVRARVGAGVAAPAVPAYVQGSGSGNQFGVSAVNVTLNGVTAGNCLVLGVGWIGASRTINTVSDNKGNTWTISSNSLSDGSGGGATAYAPNVASGNTTITATISGGTATMVAIAHEVSGCATSNTADGNNGRIQVSPTTGTDVVTSNSITTGTNGDYIFGISFDELQVTAPNSGTGFNSRVLSGFSRSEDKIQTSAGSIETTFTETDSFSRDYTFILSLKPTATVSPGVRFH